MATIIFRGKLQAYSQIRSRAKVGSRGKRENDAMVGNCQKV